MCGGARRSFCLSERRSLSYRISLSDVVYLFIVETTRDFGSEHEQSDQVRLTWVDTMEGWAFDAEQDSSFLAPRSEPILVPQLYIQQLHETLREEWFTRKKVVGTDAILSGKACHIYT